MLSICVRIPIRHSRILLRQANLRRTILNNDPIRMPILPMLRLEEAPVTEFVAVVRHRRIRIVVPIERMPQRGAVRTASDARFFCLDLVRGRHVLDAQDLVEAASLAQEAVGLIHGGLLVCLTVHLQCRLDGVR